MNWSGMLDGFGRVLLVALGYDPDDLPTDHNPVAEALRQSDFVDRFGDLKGFTKLGLCRVATVCQMVVYDEQAGPDGDWKCKALRRHWYHWFKARFMQPLALQLGDYDKRDADKVELDWYVKMSRTYAEMVDSGKVTYRDLWIEDRSRMLERFERKLFSGFNLIVAVEKDSLFDDFRDAARALGATTLYSGKGKSSKAAIERVLREHYGWDDGNGSKCIDDERPLIILHISDYDCDGEAIIGPTFGEQARRYTSNVVEARVGIDPEHVTDAGLEPAECWYRVRLHQRNYVEWAEVKALFLASCKNCGQLWSVVSAGPARCSDCGGDLPTIEVGVDEAHGLEVEVLRTRDYYGLLVDALLRVVPFEYILKRLRDECTADANRAANMVKWDVLRDNEEYQRINDRVAELEEEVAELESIRSAFRQKVLQRFFDLGRPKRNDFWDLEDDPEPEELRQHVIRACSDTGPWQPFNSELRTRALYKWLKAEYQGEIEGYKAQGLGEGDR